MSGNSEERQSWYAMVRVLGLKGELGVMEVLDTYPRKHEAIAAFLAEPNKHALAIFPAPLHVAMEPGKVQLFSPGKFRGWNWSEDLDRALDEALGRSRTREPLTMSERTERMAREEQARNQDKVVDLVEYRRRKLVLEQGL
jgi:hypothetical protein